MGWMMPFGGGLSVLLWVAIIGLVVWGVVALSRRSRQGHDAGRRSALDITGKRSALDITGKRSALDIAGERYARGEISREEFEQIRKDLS